MIATATPSPKVTRPGHSDPGRQARLFPHGPGRAAIAAMFVIVLDPIDYPGDRP